MNEVLQIIAHDSAVSKRERRHVIAVFNNKTIEVIIVTPESLAECTEGDFAIDLS